MAISRKTFLAAIVAVGLAGGFVTLARQDARAGGGPFDQQMLTLLQNVEAPEGVPPALQYPGSTLSAVGTTTLWGFPNDPLELKYNAHLCTPDSVDQVESFYDTAAPPFSPVRVSVVESFPFRCDDLTAINIVLPAETSGYADIIEGGNATMVADLPAALLVPTNQDLKVSVDQSDAGIRLDMNYFTADGSADPEETIAAIVDAITQAGTTGEVAVRADNASQLSYRNEALGTSMSISAQRLPDLAGTGTEGTQLTYIIVLSAEAAGATPGASTPAQAGPTIIVPTTAASTTGADDGDSGGSSSTMYAILAALAVVGLVGGGWFAWNRGFFAGSTGAAATTLADAPTEQGGQAPAVTVRAVADAGQQTTEVADVSTAIVIRGLLGEGTADISEEADS